MALRLPFLPPHKENPQVGIPAPSSGSTLKAQGRPRTPPPPHPPAHCSSPLSFTAWGSLWGLGPSSFCSLGPGLRSVSMGSSLKLADSRAVSRGKGSSKSTSVPRPWFVTWEPTHSTHHHQGAREKHPQQKGRFAQDSGGQAFSLDHCRPRDPTRRADLKGFPSTSRSRPAPHMSLKDISQPCISPHLNRRFQEALRSRPGGQVPFQSEH